MKTISEFAPEKSGTKWLGFGRYSSVWYQAERDLREAEAVGMRWRSCPGRAYYLKSGLAANNWSKQ